jgi:hypothetical protein
MYLTFQFLILRFEGASAGFLDLILVDLVLLVPLLDHLLVVRIDRGVRGAPGK